MTAGTSTAHGGTYASGSLLDQIPALAGLDPADPYAKYAEIAGPPFLVGNGDVAVVTTYAECFELLRHPKVSNRRGLATAFRGLNQSFMHFLDPPEHTRIRSVVNKGLTPRSVEQLSPWLESEVHRLMDEAELSPTFDVIRDVAYPLPLNAICQMLDVPLEDRPAIVRWSHPITYGFDLLAGRSSRDDQKEFRGALRDFRRYMHAMTEERRASPGDDMLSRMILAQEAGSALTDKEITMAAMGLLITGHETTVSLVGHGAIALAQHPELAPRIASDPKFTDAFVEELLRYDSPVQAMLRVAADDLEIGDLEVPAGCSMLLILGAANRDPAQFADPDRFDVERPNNRTHLALGGGPHFCPGAALGRLEARLALSALAARMVNPRLQTGGVEYRKGAMMRTQTRLELAVDSIRPRQDHPSV